MAARLGDTSCVSCLQTTSYSCLKCKLPVCNRCATFESNEETVGWLECKSVGYCNLCAGIESDTCDKGRKDGDICADNLAKKSCTKRSNVVNSDDESEGSVGEDPTYSYQNTDNKKAKKAGRRPRWSQDLLNDLIDIIVNNDVYKTKLIFINVKTQKNGEIYKKVLEELIKRAAARGECVPFNIAQLRSKFKKCVAECKKVALTIKSATGIKRFKEDKDYGPWFDQLYSLVKTRDSCQPELAVEPSAQVEIGSSTETNLESELGSEGSSSKLFVPKRPVKKKKQDPVVEAINLLRTAIENDPTKDIINFMKEDIQRSREHEYRLCQLLCSNGQNQPTQAQSSPNASCLPVQQQPSFQPQAFPYVPWQPVQQHLFTQVQGEDLNQRYQHHQPTTYSSQHAFFSSNANKPKVSDDNIQQVSPTATTTSARYSPFNGSSTLSSSPSPNSSNSNCYN